MNRRGLLFVLVAAPVAPLDALLPKPKPVHEENLITWEGIKSKIGDPLNELINHSYYIRYRYWQIRECVDNYGSVVSFSPSEITWITKPTEYYDADGKLLNENPNAQSQRC